MALYRKYRPGSFAELVGQDQVTRPLSVALDNGRINHAYLFSGPRGCGKTSSARIMARSLNCEQGPTSTPCGVCHSCVSLAPNGPGNLDVTELDAASNNSVEDMRELRDRAMFAPAESRYRIFIIDEAHMISKSGSNALLKIVEEPPAHLIFIFATTEPEKVIGTIRSRTHHYPFRLLAPKDMRGLLERTVAAEGVAVEDAVYPLAIRAGGGSPRDTLSIMDQLLAGAGPQGLTYEQARLLLGATDESLVDGAVEALAAGDSAGLFSVIDTAVDVGLEPRRFSEDLLDRLRDLMILQAVPGALDAGLVDAPTDRAQILTAQAGTFATGSLPRIATTLNEGMTQLRGATSPRLLLEIMCAKMLLAPATSSSPVAIPEQAQVPAPAYERPSVRRAREEAAKAQQPHQQAPAAEATEPATPTPEPPASELSAPQSPTPEPIQEAPESSTPQATNPQVEQHPGGEAVAQPQEAPAPDLFATIAQSWANLRQAIATDPAGGKQANIVGILLAEAVPLGIDGAELIIGHNTGALAERLNSERYNSLIQQVLRRETNSEITVRCVAGLDPAAHGLPQRPTETPAWNPSAQEEPDTHPKAEAAEEAAPNPEPEVWGEPARLGGEEDPAPAPPPPAPVVEKPAAPVPRWRERAERGAARLAAGDPQDPSPDWADIPPPEEALDPPEPEYTQEQEEADMLQARDAEAGSPDHRTALAVAMDLLEQELGARKV